MQTLTNFKIEKMTLEYLEQIKDNLQTDFDDFWNYNILKKELMLEDSHYIVAKVPNNEIVGFAGVQFVLDQADITNIVTKKSFRNMGIGTLLLESLIKICKEKNINTLTLEVNEHNNYAIKLYKKFNFKTTGLRKNYYNGKDNAIIMAISL